MAGSILLHAEGRSNPSVGIADGVDDGVDDGGGGVAVLVGKCVGVFLTVVVANGVLICVIVCVTGNGTVGVSVTGLTAEHAAITIVETIERIKYWRMTCALDKGCNCHAQLQLQQHELLVKKFVADFYRIRLATIHREAQ